MKKSLLLLLMAVLLLSGCTGEQTYHAAGNYVTTAIVAGDIAYDPDGSTLQLFSDGTCTSTLRGEEESGIWSESGSNVTITLNGKHYSGVLSGDVLSLQCVFDYTLSREEIPVSAETEPEQDETLLPESTKEPEAQAFSFAGDWYGYWVVTGATGDYSDSEGEYWDLCASITLNADGTGTMLLWDEDYSDENVLGALNITAEHEVLLVQGGFFGADEIAEKEWTLSKDSLGYESLMTASGEYEDKNGSYAYTLYLRPWGLLWDDIAESERPRSYEKWYLPLVEKEKAMPSAIWKTK